MNVVAPLRNSSWLLAASLLAAVAVIVLNGFAMPRSPAAAPHSPAEVHALLHRRDASGEWLLVADARAEQLIIYDATDGRPLGIADGRHAIGALVQRDSRLFMTGDDGRLRELRRPPAPQVAAGVH